MRSNLTEEKALMSKYEPKLVKGKYKHIPKKSDGDYEITVHEYVNPKGKVGYQYIMFKSDGEKEYSKSKGYGPEASARTFNWQEIIIEDI